MIVNVIGWITLSLGVGAFANRWVMNYRQEEDKEYLTICCGLFLIAAAICFK